MLNKPKFMSPSTNMQECTVDVNAPNIHFTCIVDGNEAIYAWQIKIYKLNDGKLVFDTGKKDWNTPFFPINEKNQNVVFDVDLKSHFAEADVYYFSAESVYDKTKCYYNRSGEEGNYTYTSYEYNAETWAEDYTDLYYIGFSNSADAYYWTIEFWGNGDITHVTSCEEVFYANTTPEIEIGYNSVYSTNQEDYSLFDDTPLTSRQYYFKARYTQNEGVQLKRYGWRLIDTTNGQVLIDTISHNQIYGIADNIVCFYNGFSYDGNYSLELFVETQNGTCVLLPAITFSVDYAITFLSNDFKVEVLSKEPAVMLNWSDSIVIGGKSNVENKYVNNYPVKGETSVRLDDNEYISFDYGANSTLDISENSYMVLSTQLLDDSSRTIFTAEGVNSDGYEVARTLTYTNGDAGDVGGVFTYYVSDAEGRAVIDTYKTKYPPSRYVWYVIILSPLLTNENGETIVKLTVTESRAVGGTYPSETLYPSASVYPYFGQWDELKDSVKKEGV